MNQRKDSSNPIWRYVAYFIFAANTLCVLILLETIVFGKPYISLFLIIFILAVLFNLDEYHIKFRLHQ